MNTVKSVLWKKIYAVLNAAGNLEGNNEAERKEESKLYFVVEASGDAFLTST